MPLVDPALLARLTGLKMRVRAVMESLLAGSQPSVQRGFSTEFAEHRPYSPGDDFRTVDWKVVAKRDRFYVRQQQHESRLRLVCGIDVSGSMRYRSAASPLSKLEYAAVAAVALLWVSQRQGHDVGLGCIDQCVELALSPSGSLSMTNQLLPALERLLAQPKKSVGATRTWEPWQHWLQQLPPRCAVVWFTDAFGDLAELGRVLQLARYLRHELYLVQILDPAELSFPFTDSVRFQDLESTDQLAVPTQRIRAAYQQEIGEFLRQVQEQSRRAQVRYQQAETEQPVDRLLQQLARSFGS